MNWQNVVKKINQYLVKIETPNGHGTGFVFLYNRSRSICGVATAAHVVDHAEKWQLPIRIRSFYSNKVDLLKESDRVIRFDFETGSDSAVVLFSTTNFSFPQKLIQLLPTSDTLPIGAEVGWIGFPSIEPYTPCFFSGNVSARKENRSAYLIDGVAINGVSGGPVFYSTDADGVRIVGVMTAYRPNLSRGDTLPGLSIAQDVTHFHKIIKDVENLDDAKAQKEQEPPADKTVK